MQHPNPSPVSSCGLRPSVDISQSASGSGRPDLALERESESPSISRLHYRALAEVVARTCPGWLRQDMDCIVQKAALKLWKQLEADESRHVTRAYLYRIANSTMIDEIRHRRTLKHSRFESRSDSLEDCAPASSAQWGAEAGLERSVFDSELQDCIRRLTENQRAATRLFLLGHSNKEIAAMLHWTEKKTESCRLRGRRLLRKCLQRKGIAQ